jgi:hypothetical protein
MPVVVVLAVLIAAGLLLVRLGDGKGVGDAPARIVTSATGRLPAHRREWGQAMLAELTRVRGRVRRWLFAAGVLRVALFPPPRHPRRVLSVAGVGLLVAAAATVATAVEVPGLWVFTAALSLLLGGYATIVASRSQLARPSPVRVIVAVVALVGLVAAVGMVLRIGMGYPTATVDHTHHVFSILFALIVTGYLALALTPPQLDDSRDTGLWWALCAALAAGAVWIGIAVTTPVDAEGILPALEPVAAAAALAASIGAATTRSLPAGVRAGLLTAILAAPIHFSVDLAGMLHLRTYALTDPYDINAYPHSGYPDVASYLLSDRVGGDIATLVILPITMLALALLGAAAGSGLHRWAVRRSPHPTA